MITPAAFSFNSSNIPKDFSKSWRLDSGATYRIYKENKIKIAECGSLISTGYRNLPTHLLEDNVISTGLAEEKGMTVVFEDNHAKILKRKDQLIGKLIKFTRLHYLFEEQQHCNTTIEKRTFKAISKQDQLWHKGFAHFYMPNVKKIENIRKKRQLRRSTIAIDSYTSCRAY